MPADQTHALPGRGAASGWRLIVVVALLMPATVWAEGPADPFLGSSYFQDKHLTGAGSPVLEGAAAGLVEGVAQVAYAGEFGSPPIANTAAFAPQSPAHVGAPPTGDASYPNGPFADLVVEPGSPTNLIGYDHPTGCDHWQILPDGLIFRSFLAGPREPRIGTKLFHNQLDAVAGSEFLWSGTVGGRRGLFRFGNDNPLRPTGVQLDIEGAALVRLNLDQERDVDASDFRFGVPLTWGDEQTQYEFGYYHLSSHIGDEFLVRNPGFVRVNYVRDVIKFGVSHYATPEWRLYGQAGYAFFVAGGAEPWEFQFGAEYSKPGVTSVWGTPFFATNAHLREEIEFGGDFSVQAGWLWRGKSGSTLRAAVHYLNGDSSIYQFFGNFEEQIGFGLFYDF